MSKIRLVLLGLLTVLAVGAVASASASAAVMPAYSGLTNNTQLKVETTKLAGSGAATLKGTLAGIEIVIECTEEHGSGFIINSEELKMGHSLGEIHYLNCTVSKPAGQGCLVFNKLILVPEVLNLLLLQGSGYRVDFSPETPPTFTVITIDGCTNTSLNNKFKVNGTAAAEVNNANSSLEFSSTSGSNLTFGGNAATYTDKIQNLMEGGGAITVINEK
jgi:hypothetical protein